MVENNTTVASAFMPPSTPPIAAITEGSFSGPELVAPLLQGMSRALLQNLCPLHAESFRSHCDRLNRFQRCMTELRDGTRVIDPLRGGNQIGCEVSLERLSPEIPVILVGDLHGNIANFKKVLLHDDNLLKISRGEAVLLLLGDLVHLEHGNIEDMRSSFRLHEFYMNLKVSYPHHVFALVGNHDPIFDWTAKVERQNGIRRIVYQAERYRAHIDSSLTASGGGVSERSGYVNTLARSTENSPLYAVLKGGAAVHAGPISGLSREEMRTRFPIDDQTTIDVLRGADNPGAMTAIPKDRVDAFNMYKQAAWQRLKGDDGEAHGYTWSDVDLFLAEVGQAKSRLIVGHTPPVDPASWMEEVKPVEGENPISLYPKHYRLTASRLEALGYVRARDGTFASVTIRGATQSSKLL